MRGLVTGGAGFIGSNIVAELLARGWDVVVLDDLSTGKRENIVPFETSGRFRFIEGSVTDRAACGRACEGVDYVFHEAAVISVPLSIEEPERTLEVNVTGSSNVFLAARDTGVKRVVWASSTSVYGNSGSLPNRETEPLRPLSPYAASKASGEMLASAMSEVYGLPVVSLRYFNVYGRRQDPFSAYAAVIPIFVARLLRGERPVIYGDGGQTRDFVYVGDVVEANIRAALDAAPEAAGRAFNIGGGKRISVNELFHIIAGEMNSTITPDYQPGRSGEVRDSMADISAARAAFGYEPSVDVRTGLKLSLDWYRENLIR